MIASHAIANFLLVSVTILFLNRYGKIYFPSQVQRLAENRLHYVTPIVGQMLTRLLKEGVENDSGLGSQVKSFVSNTDHLVGGNCVMSDTANESVVTLKRIVNQSDDQIVNKLNNAFIKAFESSHPYQIHNPVIEVAQSTVDDIVVKIFFLWSLDRNFYKDDIESTLSP